jgi:multicomponent Na+:H+ antiporter subunit F
MAHLNPWLAAVIAFLPALAAVCFAGLRGRTGERLIALELASSISVLLLVMMSFAFGRPSFIDLALALAFVSLPGTLVFTHFLERWL